MASQPRVTKFKIDWDDAKEDAENIPPTENMNGEGVSNSQSCSEPLKIGISLENSNSASAMEVS